MIMKVCAFCGTENADNETFCGLCGNRLDTIPNEYDDSEFTESSDTPNVDKLVEADTTAGDVLCPLCCGSGKLEDAFCAGINFEDQEHVRELRKTISTLSDEQVTTHFNSVIEWAKRYKALLMEELLQRGHDVQVVQAQDFNASSQSSLEIRENDFDSFDDEDPEEVPSSCDAAVSDTIDFNLAQMIQRKVAAFTIAETEEALEKLRNVPEYLLSAEEVAQLHYEIDTCELHLFDLTGDVTGQGS